MVASFAAPRILPSRLERFQGTMLGKVWKSAAHWGTDHILAAIHPSGVMAERILMLKHRWVVNTAMNKCMQLSRWSKPLSVEFIWHVVVCWWPCSSRSRFRDLQRYQIWFEVAKTMSGSWESARKGGAAGLFMNSDAVCGFHPQDLTKSLRDIAWRGFRWSSGCKWPSSWETEQGKGVVKREKDEKERLQGIAEVQIARKV